MRLTGWLLRRSWPVLLLVLLAAQPVAARTWRVEKNGSGDYAVIQDAVAASADGDTILIGPGRFTEYTDHTYAGNIWHTYVHMVAGSRTLIGAGEDATVIGPEDPGTWETWEYGVGVFFWPTSVGSVLGLRDLTLENLVDGAYAEAGHVTIANCTFRGTRVYGVWTHTPGTVQSCTFDHVEGTGIITSSPSRDFTVVDCEFRASETAVYFSGVANVSVRDCRVVDCENVGYLNQCSGEALRNVFSVTTGAGLLVYGPGSYFIADNVFDGGTANIYFGLGASNAVCERNVFRGSRDTAIDIVSCTPRINNNDIFKDRGYAVWLGGYSQLPDRYVDLTGNYWGTANRDSISAWILDGYDPVDPPRTPIHGIVTFEPFSAAPVETEKTSHGSVKALFR